MRRPVCSLLIVAMLTHGCWPSTVRSQTMTPMHGRLFSFHSPFWLNLHQFLSADLHDDF